MSASSTQLLRSQRTLQQLAASGVLVFQTAQQILDLREIVRSWIDELGVEVTFDPRTPAKLQDYFLGASLGAVEGAFAGALVGLFVGALVKAPEAGILIGAGLGGAAGAINGVRAVAAGTRVRVHAWHQGKNVIARVEQV